MYIMILFITISNSLIPSSNTGYYRHTLTAPRLDISTLKKPHISFINKYWLSQLKIYGEFEIEKLNLEKSVRYTDVVKEHIHIIQQINEMEAYLNLCKETDIFMCWTPLSDRNDRRDILFLIYGSKDENNSLDIKHVIQSPYWDSSSISSKYMKYSLIDLLNTFNSSIKFDTLYKKHPRYYLEWECLSLDN